jgi:hypothetical protein
MKNWRLNRVLVLLLSLTFVGLIIDLRSEHIDVIPHHWTAWIPIYYSGIGMVVGFITSIKWIESFRRLFFWTSVIGIFVGLLGFWFHNGDHLISNVAQVIQAWYLPLSHHDDAPVLAPLALCGLGVIGMLASAKRMQALEISED